MENGGYDYKDATVTDNKGNKYDTQIVEGKIYKVVPLNNDISSSPIPVDYLPFLNVSSNTGSGAIIRPILAALKVNDINNRVESISGEDRTIKTIIDCPT